MVTVKIEEEYLIKLLVDRLKVWTKDIDVIDLYERYYESMVECFDGGEFNPDIIVDNDWVNYTSVITKEEFEDYDIEDEDDDKILMFNHQPGRDTLYLISTC